MGSELAFARPDDETLEVRLAGEWLLAAARPSPQDVARELERRPARRVRISAQGVGSRDTGLLTFVHAVLVASGSASAAGRATTSAVVTGIVAIVCADGLAAVLTHV